MIKDIDGLINHLTDGIKSQTDVAVIGLSGGADSTLVAILCTLALGKENVVGVHMPYNKLDTEGVNFNARSIRFSRKIGIQDKYMPISGIADAITSVLGRYCGDKYFEKISDLDKGNARARARMTVLYGLTGVLSHEEYKGKKIRVVGTGNLSEDFIGYDTKGGDALTDFHPIGRLFKSEVYQLLNHFIKEGIIDEENVDRIPSAGLWEGQTDEGELGHTYNEMEPVIRKLIYTDRSAIRSVLDVDMDELTKFVYRRHLGNKHKHEAIPSFPIGEFVD